MKLVINHQTYYRYQSTVHSSQHYLRLTPQTFAQQTVHHWRVVSSGQGSHVDQLDGFNNVLTSLTYHEPYHELLIMAQGEVELITNVESVRDDRVSPTLFTHVTESTSCHEPLKAFIAAHVAKPTRSNLIDLSAAILEQMPHTSNSTTVDTTAEQAFDLKQGVCQDHTHVFLACARELGLPARYVSGYLHTLDSTHLASHAWAEAYLDGQWYCFDTSNQLFTPSQHVQLAIGRDYLDAAPVRGVCQGSVKETMQTLVQVIAV